MKRNTDAFIRYHRAKEELAQLTQVGTAALHLLRTNVSSSNGSSLLGAFVDACEVPQWTPGKKFPQPVERATVVGKMLCNQLLSQHVSLFDYYTRSEVVDFARFSTWGRLNQEPLKHEHVLAVLSPQKRWGVSPCCNEVADTLGELKSRIDMLELMLGWKPSSNIRSILPLIDLARRLRNRIAHWNGQIGSEVVEFAGSREVAEAFSSFGQKYCKSMPPALPVLIRGRMLELSPANVIFFGAVYYEIAREINDYVCGRLEDKEFVEMAFYYSCLVDTHPSRTIRHRKAESRIMHFLTSDYRVKFGSKDELISPYLAGKVLGSSGGKGSETSLWKIALERHAIISKQEAESA